MEQITGIERPGSLPRVFLRVGERIFGQVPTPERLMAQRLSAAPRQSPITSKATASTPRG